MGQGSSALEGSHGSEGDEQMKCQYRYSNGRQCGGHAQRCSEKQLCYQHDPAHKEARRRSAFLGAHRARVNAAALRRRNR